MSLVKEFEVEFHYTKYIGKGCYIRDSAIKSELNISILNFINFGDYNVDWDFHNNMVLRVKIGKFPRITLPQIDIIGNVKVFEDRFVLNYVKSIFCQKENKYITNDLRAKSITMFILCLKHKKFPMPNKYIIQDMIFPVGDFIIEKTVFRITKK